MNRFSARERALLAFGLLVLMIFVTLVLFLLPLRRQNAKLAAQEKTLTQQISEAELMYRSLPRVKEEITDLKAQIAALASSQPNPTPDVVRGIERLTSDLGLQLTSVRPAEPAYADAYTKYATTFEVQSSFGDLVRLLYELERPPYSLWVEGAVITADRDAGFLRTTVTVSVYSRHPESKASHEES